MIKKTICKLAQLSLAAMCVMIPAISAAALVQIHPNSNDCSAALADTYPVPASNNVLNSTFTSLHGGAALAGELIAGSFTASIPYQGDDVNIPDTTISIQVGEKTYSAVVSQEVFPGDTDHVVPATDNFLYANGNNTGAAYTPWSQQLNVEPGQTYSFVMYASNMLTPGIDLTTLPGDPADPILQLKIDGSPIGPVYTLDESIEAAGDDIWMRIEQSFTVLAGQTTVTLSIEDQQLGQSGDDYGITSMGLFRCELPDDSDNDGIFDNVDIDDDNDGIPDALEGVTDLDGDGVPNYLDLDSDGNGSFDMHESGISAALLSSLDADNDGMVDAGNAVGVNGLTDALETAPDSGVLDYDSDGSVDSVAETDGDGIIDALDLDSDNDGIPDVTEGSDDVDSDGLPNSLDLDSDGDGTNDLLEAGVEDSNDDGMVDNFVDANNDGYDDGLAASPAPILDDNADGVADYLDPNIQSTPAVPVTGGGGGGAISLWFLLALLVLMMSVGRRVDKQ